ncbi:MAG: thiolase domain-containing protein [Methanobacteriota archaeon]|nr:MAG: thiolase domain-containing protein [Euryarchaeota archaeon]
MAREVAVIGTGMSAFGDLGRTAKSLFTEAFTEALESVDHGLDPRDIREAYIGNMGFGGGQIGNLAALLTEHSRLLHIPTRKVENACASSGFAFRDAYLAVRSGAADVAIAGGVEVMNDVSDVRKRFWLGVSGDTEWERLAGLTFPGVYGMMAGRHMHEYGTTREQLAAVAVKNHANGALNPKAQFRKPVTLEKVLGSPIVAAPLTLYDCCATTDGAACAILADKDVAGKYTDAPVWVAGSGAASDYLAVHDRESMTRLDATIAAANAAYGQAGITAKEVDVAEVHDCFTIAEILAVEDLGFAKKGEGGRLAVDGTTAREGAIPTNPSGGLKAKGHPLGATGAAQVHEIFLQLRGDAGGRQVRNPELGLTHNVGGSGATCAVHVFRR